jgi:DNA-binding beta-propeller fold protein YncE
MYRLILFLTVVIGLSQFSFAQSKIDKQNIFADSGLWMNTDSALNSDQLTIRHPLLLVQFSPNDPSLPDLSHKLSEIQSRFPFMHIVGSMSCSEPYQFDPQEIRYTIRRGAWKFPLYSFMEKPSESKPVSMSYQLFGVGMLIPSITENIDELSSFEQSVNSWVANQIGMQNVPHSYICKPELGLTDLQLFSNPSGLAVDPDYEYLIIADTDHHRLILCDLDGRIIESIGTGRPGSLDGRTEEAMFNFPSGLAYDKANRILYIADRGNSSIRSVDIEGHTVRTLTLVDEDDRLFTIPSPISDLDFQSGELILSSPGIPNFWKVDLNSMRTRRVHGAIESGNQVSKNPLKTQLRSASGYSFMNNLDFYLDEKAGNLYSADEGRSNLILSEDSLLAMDKKAMFNSELHGITGITEHEGRLVCWNRKSSTMMEIDPYSYTISDLPVDTGQVLPVSISDMVSVGDDLYLLDPISSMVFKLNGKKMERLLFKERKRALHMENPADLFLPMDPIQLLDSGQTSIILSPIIPPHFSLDPITRSSIYVSGGRSAGVFLEGTLGQEDLTLIVFPEVKSNQINLMAEINFCDKSDPWSCYQRWVTVNIPVLQERTDSLPKTMDLDLFKGL